MYFIFIIIGAGGMSIWTGLRKRIELGSKSDVLLIKNIATLSVAIIASGAIELFTDKKHIKTALFSSRYH